MNIHEAKRVIVISDAHGHLDLIENALADAGFDPERDGLIYAGDLVDGGTTPEQSRACINLLKQNGAQFLWGNHDVAVLLDYWIPGQEVESRPALHDEFRAEFASSRPLRWRLAVRVQGVFVTHAGISTDYLNDYLFDSRDKHTGELDQDAFVERLNVLFDRAAARQLETHDEESHKFERIFGRRAPHRFRAFDWHLGPDRVLPGVVQVAGHSAPETYAPDRSPLAKRRPAGWTCDDLKAAGLHIVDPSYQNRREGTGGFRSAVIEGGDVRVLEQPSGVLR